MASEGQIDSDEDEVFWGPITLKEIKASIRIAEKQKARISNQSKEKRGEKKDEESISKFEMKNGVDEPWRNMTDDCNKPQAKSDEIFYNTSILSNSKNSCEINEENDANISNITPEKTHEGNNRLDSYSTRSLRSPQQDFDRLDSFSTPLVKSPQQDFDDSSFASSNSSFMDASQSSVHEILSYSFEKVDPANYMIANINAQNNLNLGNLSLNIPKSSNNCVEVEKSNKKLCPKNIIEQFDVENTNRTSTVTQNIIKSLFPCACSNIIELKDNENHNFHHSNNFSNVNEKMCDRASLNNDLNNSMNDKFVNCSQETEEYSSVEKICQEKITDRDDDFAKETLNNSSLYNTCKLPSISEKDKGKSGASTVTLGTSTNDPINTLVKNKDSINAFFSPETICNLTSNVSKISSPLLKTMDKNDKVNSFKYSIDAGFETYLNGTNYDLNLESPPNLTILEDSVLADQSQSRLNKRKSWKQASVTSGPMILNNYRLNKRPNKFFDTVDPPKGCDITKSQVVYPNIFDRKERNSCEKMSNITSRASNTRVSKSFNESKNSLSVPQSLGIDSTLKAKSFNSSSALGNNCSVTTPDFASCKKANSAQKIKYFSQSPSSKIPSSSKRRFFVTPPKFTTPTSNSVASTSKLPSASQLIKSNTFHLPTPVSNVKDSSFKQPTSLSSIPRLVSSNSVEKVIKKETYLPLSDSCSFLLESPTAASVHENSLSFSNSSLNSSIDSNQSLIRKIPQSKILSSNSSRIPKINFSALNFKSSD